VDQVDAPGTGRGRPSRRRRPSGEPPPLPRNLERSGQAYLALGAVVVALWAAAFYIAPFSDVVTRLDLRVAEAVERARFEPLTTVMRWVHLLGSEWTIRPLRWALIVALLLLRRFRHLLVLLATTLVISVLTLNLADAIARPRPLGIDTLVAWRGFSHPSAPVAAFAITAVGILYTLLPHGEVRNRGKVVTGVLVTALGVSRVYLGVDHPTDVLVAVVIGMAMPVVAFRLLTPNDVFPVRYSRGRAAHLDVGGRRGAAIQQALAQQLGIDVVAITPFNLDGSAGSTPLRLTMAGEDGEPPLHLFGKLYAGSHLRSDRSYKLVRTIRYGRLEDEHPFRSVRALVEYEDYLLRLMRDAGLPTAEPYGIVEITPEREYLLVTDFLEGASEIDDVEVDDELIDQALAVVHRLWESGLAHRDIKPANVLVRDGRVHLIDVAFATVRPSPWRQAVDLANMMLVLALRTTPERVYERALRRFSPTEIAEAFAATHGVTLPSQLRAQLRADGRDLVACFRELAPETPYISIQRWTWRRAVLTAVVVSAAVVAVPLIISNLRMVGLR
jgi:tRNA A-37 threonylcarbamoyl transferase component Bud32/membrane-associated phospholipid phosphatase